MLVQFFTISNLLSLLRAPLAFLFLPAIVPLRVTVLVLAAVTDWLDGFIARRFSQPTQVGAVLDPVMDKFFMVFVFSVLVAEGSLAGWQMFALLFRDLCLIGFVLFLLAGRRLRTYRPRGIWWGKVTTAFQYAALLLVVLGVPFPPILFGLFFLFGLLYLGELLAYYRQDAH